jgi:hypothetical protein
VNPFDKAQDKSVECTREQDVLDALTADCAVQDWGDELRTHVEACAICRDIVAVALPLLQEHHAAVDDAHPPSSGIVWWRATMRARQEAAQAATRPITVVQGVALASGAAVFMMILSAAAPTLSGWFGGLSTFGGISEFFTLPQVDLSSLMPTTGTGLLLVGACLVCLLLGPLAVYFAADDE